MSRKERIGTCAFLLAALLATSPTAAAPLKVFAAASLTDALDQALSVCAQKTGTAAIGVYAGSGTGARQVAQGAPASIYISANPQWMDWLEKRGLIASDTRVDLLANRLVFVASPQTVKSLETKDILVPEFYSAQRIAVADLQTVPAGIYARQALEANGWWDHDGFQAGLVQAANVREALTWVVRGETGFSIVYETDALNEAKVEIVSRFPAEYHDPIRYPAAVISDHDSPESRSLLTCLTGKEASEVFSEFGFELLE